MKIDKRLIKYLKKILINNLKVFYPEKIKGRLIGPKVLLKGSKGGGSNQSQLKSIMKIKDFLSYDLSQVQIENILTQTFNANSITFSQKKSKSTSYIDIFNDQNLSYYYEEIAPIAKKYGY